MENINNELLMSELSSDTLAALQAHIEATTEKEEPKSQNDLLEEDFRLSQL